MIRGYSKEKNKEKRKRDKELIDMSMQLRPSIREGFLHEFLKMCKAKHQLAFFQWRNRYAPLTEDCSERRRSCYGEETSLALCQECFDTQVGFARENNTRLAQMLKEAEDAKAQPDKNTKAL
jgi:hypothetical protein